MTNSRGLKNHIHRPTPIITEFSNVYQNQVGSLSAIRIRALANRGEWLKCRRMITESHNGHCGMIEILLIFYAGLESNGNTDISRVIGLVWKVVNRSTGSTRNHNNRQNFYKTSVDTNITETVGDIGPILNARDGLKRTARESVGKSLMKNFSNELPSPPIHVMSNPENIANQFIRIIAQSAQQH